MTIITFLLARIEEEEAEALNAPKMSDVYDVNRLAFTATMRQKALAECAAKRAIIGLAKQASEVEQEFDDYEWQGTVERSEPLTGDAILSALAAVYKDHPDYQQEWDQA